MKIRHINLKGLLFFGLIILMIGCQKNIVPTTDSNQYTLKGKDLQNYTYLFSEALKNKVIGDIPKSIDYYEKCLLINPNSDAALYELSSLYSMVGDYRKSLYYARAANNKDPENLWYKLQLANLYRAVNLNDSSILVYEDIHRSFPDRADLYFNLGNLYAEGGRYEDGLRVFKELEEVYGFNENIVLAKEEIYEILGQYDLAEREILQLIEYFPDRTEFKIVLAELNYVQGQNDVSQEIYSNIFESEGNTELFIVSKIGFYKHIKDHQNLKTLLDTMIRAENMGLESKLQILMSLVEDPEPLSFDDMHETLLTFREVYKDESRIIALIADHYSRNAKYELAKNEYYAYLKKDKSNYLVWEQLLFIENVLGNYQALYDLSKEALRVFRGAPVVYFFNGVACTELNKFNEAEKIFTEGLQYASQNQALTIQYYALLGETYRNLGNDHKSDESFENALKLEPENLLVLNNYSYYLALRGVELKKALKMSEITIKSEPNNSTYLDTYGWVLYRMEKYSQARKYIERAIEYETNPSAEILEHYGDILSKLGDHQTAIEFWQKALDRGGDQKELNTKISNAQK